MKKHFETLKIIWADERGRALIKLGIYLIFIIFVIMYARSMYSGSNNEIKTKTVFEKYVSETSYSEKIVIDDKEYSLTNNNNYMTFNDSTISYAITDNQVKMVSNSQIVDFDIYFWNLTPSLIGKLVNKKQTYYVTEYNDKSVDKAYKIPLTDFIQNFDGSSLDIEALEEITNQEIMIIINETKEKVSKVSLDISSYYELVTGMKKTYNVQIEY